MHSRSIPIKWTVSFLKKQHLRTTFNTWKIPAKFINQYAIKDGEYCTLTISLEGTPIIFPERRITSGGEILISSEDGRELRSKIKKNPRITTGEFEILISPRTKESLDEQEAKEISRACQLSDAELLRRIQNTPIKASKISVIAERFQRNPNVVAFALHRAKGRCEGCRLEAPFTRRSNGEPYLEVHHIKSLSDDGPDTPENVEALCPNCHRKRHHG